MIDIVGQQGTDRFLVAAGDGNGIVVDTSLRQAYAEMPIGSLLARGYWFPYKPDPESRIKVERLLDRARPSKASRAPRVVTLPDLLPGAVVSLGSIPAKRRVEATAGLTVMANRWPNVAARITHVETDDRPIYAEALLVHDEVSLTLCGLWTDPRFERLLMLDTSAGSRPWTMAASARDIVIREFGHVMAFAYPDEVEGFEHSVEGGMRPSRLARASLDAGRWQEAWAEAFLEANTRDPESMSPVGAAALAFLTDLQKGAKAPYGNVVHRGGAEGDLPEAERRYSEDQPRVPAGVPEGGEWTADGGSGSSGSSATGSGSYGADPFPNRNENSAGRVEHLRSLELGKASGDWPKTQPWLASAQDIKDGKVPFLYPSKENSTSMILAVAMVPYGKIAINLYHWDEKTPLERAGVLYHELGHFATAAVEADPEAVKRLIELSGRTPWGAESWGSLGSTVDPDGELLASVYSDVVTTPVQIDQDGEGEKRDDMSWGRWTVSQRDVELRDLMAKEARYVGFPAGEQIRLHGRGKVTLPERSVRYAPDQSRDYHGRFADEGGGADADAVVGRLMSDPDFRSKAENPGDTAAGTAHGDVVLTMISEQRGTAGPPKIADRAGMDALVADGWHEMYRGERKGAYADALRTGDAHYGAGIHGNGIYTVGVEGQDSTNEALLISNHYGRPSDDGTKGAVVRMALDPSAKIIDYSDALAGSAAALHEAKRPEGEQDAYEQVVLDPGRWAALNGYDAIRIDPEIAYGTSGSKTSNYVILSRSRLAVQSENVDPDLIAQVSKKVLGRQPAARYSDDQPRVPAGGHGGGQFASGGSTGAAPDGVAALKSLSDEMGNERPERDPVKGDLMAARLTKELGTDGPPRVVKTAEFDGLVKDGWTPMYRVIASGSSEPGSSERYARQFEQGPAYWCCGVYGTGVYAASSSAYGPTVLNGMRDTPDSTTLRMAISPDAKTIEWRDAYSAWIQAAGERPETQWDEGHFAMAMGYDAIHVPDSEMHAGMDYWVILNRGKIAVEAGAKAEKNPSYAPRRSARYAPDQARDQKGQFAKEDGGGADGPVEVPIHVVSEVFGAVARWTPDKGVELSQGDLDNLRKVGFQKLFWLGYRADGSVFSTSGMKEQPADFVRGHGGDAWVLAHEIGHAFEDRLDLMEPANTQGLGNLIFDDPRGRHWESQGPDLRGKGEYPKRLEYNPSEAAASAFADYVQGADLMAPELRGWVESHMTPGWQGMVESLRAHPSPLDWVGGGKVTSVAGRAVRYSEGQARDDHGRFASEGGSFDYETSSTVAKMMNNPSDPEVATGAMRGRQGAGECPLATSLARELGKDGKPTVASAQAIDAMVASGSPEMLRGVVSSDYADQLRDGPLRLSAGLMGAGIYFTANRGAAEKFALGGDVHSAYVSDADAVATSPTVIRATLSPDAKVIDYDDASKQCREAFRADMRLYEKRPSEADMMSPDGVSAYNVQHRLIGARMTIENDPGTWALTQGYDAIAIRNQDGSVGGHIVVNRSMLIVQDEDSHPKPIDPRILNYDHPVGATRYAPDQPRDHGKFATVEGGAGVGGWPDPQTTKAGIEDATSAWTGIHFADLREFIRTGHVREGYSEEEDPIHGISPERAAQSVSTLTRLISTGPQAPALWRGISVDDDTLAQLRALPVGSTVDTSITAWSTNGATALLFASRGGWVGGDEDGHPTTNPVLFRLGNAKGFDMSPYAVYEHASEGEWITDGRFVVQSVQTAEEGMQSGALVVTIEQQAVWSDPGEMEGKS